MFAAGREADEFELAVGTVHAFADGSARTTEPGLGES
jgi:hypothetical protein